MNKILIIIPIIVGTAISLPFLIDSTRLLEEKSFENIFKNQVETDFMNKIREAGDDSKPMTFAVISKQDLFNRHENYCGHAHMVQKEYWYFADTFDDALLSSSVVQGISSWCEDDNDSCYCELREFIGVDRRSYENFFREHVSETCPVIPMPKTATSFDPTKCQWIEDEDTVWVLLPITSCGYPWHESNHEKTKQYFVEYRNIFGNYDSSDPFESAEAMHYVIARYYEDLGKDILDVRTSVDHSMPKTGEGCHATVGATWHLKIQNTDLEYFLDNGYIELENEGIFHGKSLSYWQNLDDDSLVQYYENFRNHEENFFDDLGVFLIKSYSEEKLLELGIVPAHEIEVDWTGIRPSLPPRMGFDAKVNSTDGKSYLILGTIHGNEILDNFRIAEDNGRRIGWTPAFEYSRVQITGITALQICSMIEIDCIKNPVWDAIHRHDKDFTFFHYDTYGIEPDVQIGEHYIQIDKGQVCHSFEDLLSQQISEFECVEIEK